VLGNQGEVGKVPAITTRSGGETGTRGHRRQEVNRVHLTSQELAALLDCLSQGGDHRPVRPEPEPLKTAPPPASRSIWEPRGSPRFQRISHWWAIITELQWPQL
jgi:hypothetical protein